MKRRDFLKTGLAASFWSLLPIPAIKPAVLAAPVRVQLAQGWCALENLEWELTPSCTTFATYRGSPDRIKELRRILTPIAHDLAMISRTTELKDRSGWPVGLIYFGELQLNCMLPGIWVGRRGAVWQGNTNLICPRRCT